MAIGDFPLFEVSYNKAKENMKMVNAHVVFLENENKELRAKLKAINKITLEDYKDTFDIINRIIKINKIVGGDL